MRVYTLLALFLFGVTITSCKKEEKNNDISPNDFLSANHYNELVVEIQSMEGYTPNQETLDNLKVFLEALLNKPNGISITSNTIGAQGKGTYNIDQIADIEKNNRTQNIDDRKVAAYVLFLDGEYAGNDGNSKVLGIQYNPTSMVMFEKTIQDLTGGIGQPSETVVESAVLQHEFGHTLGLVNNGTEMKTNHQDVENGAHCDNQDCLMYYATETSNFIANLVGGNIPKLDANCKADLKANGGK